MYFTKIKKTQAQLEVMISILQMEYNADTDEKLAVLMAKYFEVALQDAQDSIKAYRAFISEDYEQQSKAIQYA